MGARPGGGIGAPGIGAGAAAIGARPSTRDLHEFLGLPGEAASGAHAGDRAGQARDQIANRPNAQNRQDNRDQRRDNVSQNREQRQQQLKDKGDQIRDQFQDNHPRWDFWKDHPNWAAYRFNHPYHWATGVAVAGWLGMSSAGAAYDYGGSTVYQDGSVYTEGQPVATEEQYAEQAQAIAATGAENLDQATQQNQQIEWLPLGVFALSDQSGAESTMLFQLAVAKDGTIGGTFYNVPLDQTLPVQGSVDKKTQRAAWTIGDKSQTVFETGLSNLTQDQTSVLVHFGKDKTQTWMLARLPDPEATKAAGQ